MARSSPKHFLVMLLAVFLAVGFSLATAQASVMSARMMMMTGSDMAMPAEPGTVKIADASMNGVCKACLKGAGDGSTVIHCPPSCIAPALAVLPQGLAMATVLRLRQPSALVTPFLRGRNLSPDPFPPRPSDLI